MASVVAICNMALGHIGSNKTIASLTELSPEAKACRTYYEQSRDAILGMNDWEFAKAQVTLQLVDDFTLPAGNWTYAYAYPPNTVKIRKIIRPLVRNEDERQKIPFELYDDDALERTIVLTDMQYAVAEITRLKTNTQNMPPLFVDALSWLIAMKICNPLRVDAATSQKALNGFNFWFDEATAHDGAEVKRDQRPDSEFIRART